MISERDVRCFVGSDIIQNCVALGGFSESLSSPSSSLPPPPPPFPTMSTEAPQLDLNGEQAHLIVVSNRRGGGGGGEE